VEERRREDSRSSGEFHKHSSSGTPSGTTSGVTGESDSRTSGLLSGRGVHQSRNSHHNGEVTGSEDLFIDGHLEGKLNLGNSTLTVGPNGEIKADIYRTPGKFVVRGSRGRQDRRPRENSVVEHWNCSRAICRPNV